MGKNIVATVGLVALGCCTQAWAQAAQSSDTLQEVVVTAELVQESVEKAPISVTVFDNRALRQMGAQSFIDYAPSVPALSFQALGPGEQRILLRGVSDGVDIGLRGATQGTTGVYIDDMVVSNNETAPDLNLFDVQRVEVLKGPQGTLYGDGSVGGLLRIITNKADATRTEGTVEATGADIDHGGGEYAVNGMVNLPLVQDKAALRLVGQYLDNQGFIDDARYGRKGVNNMREIGGRAALRWLPADGLSVDFKLLYQKSGIANDNDYNRLLGGSLARNTIYEEPKTTRFTLSNLTVNWSLPLADLVSSTSYAIYDHDDFADFTDFLESVIDNAFGIPGVVLPSQTESRQHSKTFSQEVRLVSPTDRKLSWVGGLYFYRVDEIDSELDISHGLYDFSATQLGLPITGTPLDVGPVPDVAFSDLGVRRDRRQFAAFGELSYRLTQHVTATVGARWFEDRFYGLENAGGFFNQSPVVSLSKQASDHSQVFRFRLADQINDDALVYALASEGYRAGGLNPLNPATVNDKNFPVAFQPDKLWSYELGSKTRLLDRHLSVNGALFLIDWSNEQIQLGLPSGFTVIANAGKTLIKGAEAEIAAYPAEGVQVGLSGSYVRSELRRDLLSAGGQVVGRSGDQLPGVPKTQGSIYGQWSFAAGGEARGVLRGDLQYVGRTARYYAHETDVPAPADQFQSYGDYGLVNLRGGLEWPKLSVMLFVRNLADRRAVFFRGLQGTSVTATRDDVYIAQPRTIGITLRKTF